MALSIWCSSPVFFSHQTMHAISASANGYMAYWLNDFQLCLIRLQIRLTKINLFSVFDDLIIASNTDQ